MAKGAIGYSTADTSEGSGGRGLRYDCTMAERMVLSFGALVTKPRFGTRLGREGSVMWSAPAVGLLLKPMSV